MIKVENIKGKLIMVGADDDSFWEAGNTSAVWISA